MERNPENDQQKAQQDPIEERLLDSRETDHEDIVGAAREGFEEDQRDPDHPTRIKRDSGVDDPAHSRGSRGAGPE